jgi:hypothetical protein
LKINKGAIVRSVVYRTRSLYGQFSFEHIVAKVLVNADQKTTLDPFGRSESITRPFASIDKIGETPLQCLKDLAIDLRADLVGDNADTRL